MRMSSILPPLGGVDGDISKESARGHSHGVTTKPNHHACRNAANWLHSVAMNRLLFGDNLGWLRDKNVFPDACVDLVYLDPPFNSNAKYNVPFKDDRRLI